MSTVFSEFDLQDRVLGNQVLKHDFLTLISETNVSFIYVRALIFQDLCWRAIFLEFDFGKPNSRKPPSENTSLGHVCPRSIFLECDFRLRSLVQCFVDLMSVFGGLVLVFVCFFSLFGYVG